MPEWNWGEVDVDSISRRTGGKWTGRLARPVLMKTQQAKWDSADQVGSLILFFQMWRCERRRRERERLYALCQGFYLDIALFDRILVDFEWMKLWCVCVQEIMRQWTPCFGTVKGFGWKDTVSLMRLSRWMWVLGKLGYPFVICVHWRSGAWTSLEGFG
jgi:hypothetical protein